MSQDRKEQFRAAVRRALGLLRVKVDASGTGLDEEYVKRLISSACIWLSGGVMDAFDPEDWSELAPRDRRALERAVTRFRVIAAAVNPRDGKSNRTFPEPATRDQQAEAEKCLLTVARLLGVDVQGVVNAKREEILATAGRHGAYNVRVFGSVARGEAGARSDVDFLVQLEPGRSLMDLGGLVSDLQDLLGCGVDVVTENGLRQDIRKRVLREAVPL
jgi:uncharacterized protein